MRFTIEPAPGARWRILNNGATVPMYRDVPEEFARRQCDVLNDWASASGNLERSPHATLADFETRVAVLWPDARVYVDRYGAFAVAHWRMSNCRVGQWSRDWGSSTHYPDDMRV